MPALEGGSEIWFSLSLIAPLQMSQVGKRVSIISAFDILLFIIEMVGYPAGLYVIAPMPSLKS